MAARAAGGVAVGAYGMAKKPRYEALVTRHDCEASFSQLFNLYARNRANESQFSSHECFGLRGTVLRTASLALLIFAI